MSEVKTIYQTLEDRNNIDEIEANGPFLCERVDAWLGTGYYFWDTFISNAHTWGEVAYKRKYVICEATITFDPKLCYDLHNNLEQVKEFESICDEFVKQGISKRKNLTVATVITALIDKGLFDYDAIRANGVKSFNSRKQSLKFAKRYNAFLDFSPAIQICLLKKEALNLRCFKVVFPKNRLITVA